MSVVKWNRYSSHISCNISHVLNVKFRYGQKATVYGTRTYYPLVKNASRANAYLGNFKKLSEATVMEHLK